MLTLNGNGAGPVNNFAVMSQVAPTYAPTGKHLISVSVLGTQELTEAQLSGFVTAQMKNWFGVVARSWRLLKGQHRHFRWEIPYPCIVRLAEKPELVAPTAQERSLSSQAAMTETAQPAIANQQPESGEQEESAVNRLKAAMIFPRPQRSNI
jgi:hypothetical protein